MAIRGMMSAGSETRKEWICETEWNATVLTPGIYARSQENNKRLGCFQ